MMPNCLDVVGVHLTWESHTVSPQSWEGGFLAFESQGKIRLSVSGGGAGWGAGPSCSAAAQVRAHYLRLSYLFACHDCFDVQLTSYAQRLMWGHARGCRERSKRTVSRVPDHFQGICSLCRVLWLCLSSARLTWWPGSALGVWCFKFYSGLSIKQKAASVIVET